MVRGEGAPLAAGCEDAPREKGAYIIIVHVGGPVEAKTSKGYRILCPGFYLYVGSAGGPGGLRARIGRHIRGPRRRHWHIDWVTGSPSCRVLGAVYSPGCWGVGVEACLAECLSGRGLHGVEGFGATDDKRSRTHLFRAEDREEAFSAARSCMVECCGGWAECRAAPRL